MIGAFVVLLAGCGASPFEGTWLFAVDQAVVRDGDCAEAPSETEGKVFQWVDVYATGGDELVVLYEEALIGVPDGDALLATWEDARVVGADVAVESIEVDAALTDDGLAGDVRHATGVELSTGTTSCTETWAFTAERVVSDPDRYAGAG